jgi:hypothetical protein
VAESGPSESSAYNHLMTENIPLADVKFQKVTDNSRPLSDIQNLGRCVYFFQGISEVRLH